MKHVHPDHLREFALRWVLLSGLGMGGGLALGLGLAVPIESLVGMMLVTPITLTIAGSVFGTGQWLAIGCGRRPGARWVAASAIGLGVGMTLGIVLVETVGRLITGEQVRLVALSTLGSAAGLALVGLVTGLILGTSQWIALRKVAMLQPRWIAYCSFAFALGLPVGSLASELFVGGLRSFQGSSVFLLVAGLTVGGLTVAGAIRIPAGLSSRRAVA